MHVVALGTKKLMHFDLGGIANVVQQNAMFLSNFFVQTSIGNGELTTF
jgi:hypothetical protein